MHSTRGLVLPRRLLAAAVSAAGALHALGQAELTFIAPPDNSFYKLGTEIPVMLSAYSPDDVFGGAELFANGVLFANAASCCWLCPCAHPVSGIRTTLQIPSVQDPNRPAENPWQGWRPAVAGKYVLTARAYGESGTVVEAVPVTVVVEGLDLNLRVALGTDGTLNFALPEGSLVSGGFAMELSHDLKTWAPLGPFEPGNVAAFFRDRPDPADVRPRFYRAVPSQ